VATNKQNALRRASLFVRNMERSIAFYAGAFDLSIYADLQAPLSVVPHFPVGEPGRGGGVRLVVLKGSNPLIGMIGLIEVGDPPLDERPTGGALGFGDVALVLESRDVDAAARKVTSLGGTILQTPTEGRNLGDEAGNFVPARVMMVRDPDGYFLEVFETL